MSLGSKDRKVVTPMNLKRKHESIKVYGEDSDFDDEDPKLRENSSNSDGLEIKVKDVDGVKVEYGYKRGRGRPKGVKDSKKRRRRTKNEVNQARVNLAQVLSTQQLDSDLWDDDEEIVQATIKLSV